MNGEPGRSVREPKAAAAGRPERDASIDLVRGLALVMMASDHARDFVLAIPGPPETWPEAGSGLFAARWATHWCPTAFMLLAGVGAALWAGRHAASGHGARRRTSLWLATRGLWLIVLEFTVVHAGWHLRLPGGWAMAQVIWALGASMLTLAGLVWLPRWMVGGLGAVLVLGHEMLGWLPIEAATHAAADGREAWTFATAAWAALHVPATVPLGPVQVFTLYPAGAWVGVVLLGYGIGGWWSPSLEIDRRRARLLVAAGACLALAAGLRLWGGYGEPRPWAAGEHAAGTLRAFINVTKYPPSPVYLLTTLGLTGLLLAWWPGRARGLAWMVDLGRAPLAFYVLHLFVLHALAAGALAIANAGTPLPAAPMTPAAWGWWLAVWAAGVAVLWPVCAWVARVKRRRRDWWLGYL